MRTLAEVFIETLLEEKPYRVRVSGREKTKGQMRVTMSDAEAQRHRSPDVLRDREPKVGDHIRRPYDWNTVSVVTHVEKKPAPDKYGNTHTITHQALGRIWAKNNSGSPAGDSGYVPSKRPSPLKKVSVGLHPKHGWHSNPGKWTRDDWQPQGREHFVVKPKEANFTDFYKGKK